MAVLFREHFQQKRDMLAGGLVWFD